MRKLLLVLVLGAFSLTDMADAAHGDVSRSRPEAPSFHGGGKAPSGPPKGMEDVIKDATLPAYKNIKIGEAFERYRHFRGKSWRVTRAGAGKSYVDFTGSAPSGFFDVKARRQGVSAKGVEVKFVIYPSGEYGVSMVSRVEVKYDGRINRSPIADASSVLDAIYNNRKIDL